jgi:hypothetical protein
MKAPLKSFGLSRGIIFFRMLSALEFRRVIALALAVAIASAALIVLPPYQRR